MQDVTKRDSAGGVQPKQKTFETFFEVAETYVAENKITSPDVMQFAKYLDARNTLGGHALEIMALKGAREIEKEILNALIEEIGVPRAQEIIKPLIQKHKH